MRKYEEYRYLNVTIDNGVALVEISHPDYDSRGHWEMSHIWADVEDDPDVRVVVLTWADPPQEKERGPHIPKQYEPWGDTDVPGERFSYWQQVIREAGDILRGVMNSNKCVVSAIRGEVTWGAGIMAATLADISIASETIKFRDRHLEGGLAACDGITFWILSCGIQKAKFYALTSEEITGAEAERIGLVSRAVPEEDVFNIAMEYARKLADGPQHAISFTKRAMNQSQRLLHLTSFEYGLSMETMGLLSDPDPVAIRTSPGFTERKDGNWIRPSLPSTSNPSVPPK
jgi:enoyl-CoA hydratase